MQRLVKVGLSKLVLILLLFTIETISAATFDDENLALLDVVFDRQEVGDGIDAYLNGDDIFMPLIDLVALLEINVVVDSNGARGVVVNDEGEFVLSKVDGGGWDVAINGEVQPVSTQSIKIFEDYIYIERVLALEWFGAAFELDFNDSYMHLTTTKSLPFQEKLLRKKRVISAQGDLGEPEQPALKLPYAMAEIPSVDARVNFLSRRHDKEEADDFSSVFYAMRTYGDLLGMNAQTFWTGRRDEGIQGASISFDRFDSTRSMGGIGLSQFSFGDLSHPALPLAPGSYGRGVILGNDIVSGDSSRNIRDIDGDFYPGWEVELYLNGTIIGYQTIGESGRYSFKDVILFQGKNEFSLKFYGPSGQVEEKKEYISVGADSDNLNNFYYTLSASQPDRKVYEIGDDAVRAQTADDLYQASLITRYTFGSVFSLQAGAQETGGGKYQESNVLNLTDEEDIDDEVRRQYYSLELQANIKTHSLSITGAKQNERELSYLYRLGGSFGGMAYRLDYRDYGDFKDTFKSDSINNFYALSLNKRFKRSSIVFKMNRSENDLQYYDEYRLGISGSAYRVNWSNNLLYENTVFSTPLDNASSQKKVTDLESFSGAFIVSTSLSSFIARLTAAYDILPDSQLSKLNISTSYRLYPKANVNFDFSHSLVTNDNQYRVGLNWQLSHFQITPSVIYSDDGLWQGQVQLSTSLGKRTGRLGSYYDLSSNPSMSKGAVRARLFEDQNSDGEYQRGEPLLSGGEVQAVQTRRRGRSNKAGVAWLDSMQPWTPTDIVIDSNTLDAGAMALTREPFSIASRPGKVIELDLPFTRVGDFDGNVYDVVDGIHNPVRGVIVVLINKAGEKLKQEITDTDGYFDFSKLIPGDYTLEVEGGDLMSVTPELITITPDGNYVAGVEVIIQRLFDEEDESEIIPLLNGPSSSLRIEKNKNVESLVDERIAPPAFGNPAPVRERLTVINTPIDDDEMLLNPAVEVSGAPQVVSSKNAKTEFISKEGKGAENTSSAWSLQAGSFSNEIIAEGFSKKLEASGYQSKITPVVVNNKDFYRVFALGFDDREKAAESKVMFDEKFGVKSLVVKL